MSREKLLLGTIFSSICRGFQGLFIVAENLLIIYFCVSGKYCTFSAIRMPVLTLSGEFEDCEENHCALYSNRFYSPIFFSKCQCEYPIDSCDELSDPLRVVSNSNEEGVGCTMAIKSIGPFSMWKLHRCRLLATAVRLRVYWFSVIYYTWRLVSVFIVCTYFETLSAEEG